MDIRENDLDIIVQSFRENLLRDKVLFQHALDDFLNSRKPPHHEPDYMDNRLYANDIVDATRAEMLDTRRVPNGSRGQQPMEAPKYGLPGMGQYEEKQKKYKEQLKNEYRNYMREQNASKPRRRLGNEQNGSTLDYEQMLTRKREEERNYRNQNDGFANGGIRANSDGYLNRMPQSDYNNGLRQNVDVRPEVDEVTGMLNRIQQYSDQLASSRDDEDVRYDYSSYAAAAERPHSYPHDTYLPPIATYQHGPQTTREARRRSESPKFVTLDSMNPRANKAGIGGPANYHTDLERQMEDSRFRRQKEKEEQLRLERKLEEENKAYDPWGRGGGGAPMRDRDGNVIANRRYLSDDEKQKSNRVSHPPPVTNANNRRRSDTQETVANYAIPRSPIPGQSNRYKDKKTNHEMYQEDLRRQIEEKKEREKAEKEKERIEEARLMRRIQEENEKINRDHEEEMDKQRVREEERRRRNEELQKQQEKQRKAAEMEQKNKRRHEREVTAGRQGLKDKEDMGRKSPPLPARKSKVNPVATNRPTIVAQTAVGKRTQTAIQGPSKDHILSQLSTMRQQLEKEQQVMQKQLKKEMGGGYEVFDKRTMDAATERNRAPSDNRNKPSIYRPMTPPPQLNPPVKKVPSAVKYNLPAYKDFVNSEERSATTPVATVVKTRTLWPAMAMALRATDGIKPLQGESLFLGVDGYDTPSPRAHRRKADWERDGARPYDISDEYQYDVDQLAAHDAARRRYLSTLTDDPDEIKEDSFLDEFLAKNLQR